uniref:(northern house mosquito) hypothetical protein n=1 Tax=Culex pipiens TaxID=7175 RepID=A0A8D8A1P9_CULPI
MDSLLRERDIDYLLGGAVRVRSDSVRVGEREPYGGVKSFIQDYHHVPMVPALVGDSVLEQEGLAGGEDHVFPFGRLLPRVRWTTKRRNSCQRIYTPHVCRLEPGFGKDYLFAFHVRNRY